MRNLVNCHNCRFMYDCERTYLGGCTEGEEYPEEAPNDVYGGFARTALRAMAVVGAGNGLKKANTAKVDKCHEENEIVGNRGD